MTDTLLILPRRKESPSHVFHALCFYTQESNHQHPSYLNPILPPLKRQILDTLLLAMLTTGRSFEALLHGVALRSPVVIGGGQQRRGGLELRGEDSSCPSSRVPPVQYLGRLF